MKKLRVSIAGLVLLSSSLVGCSSEISAECENLVNESVNLAMVLQRDNADWEQVKDAWLADEISFDEYDEKRDERRSRTEASTTAYDSMIEKCGEDGRQKFVEEVESRINFPF